MESIFGTLVDVVTMLLARLVIVGIGALGAWLISKLAQTQKLKHIEQAVKLVTEAAQTTVLELQQTVVGPLKEANGGKLPEADKKALANDLKLKAKEKLSPTIIKLIVGAGIDLDALIQGVGEQTVLYLPHSDTQIMAEKPPDEAACSEPEERAGFG